MGLKLLQSDCPHEGATYLKAGRKAAFFFTGFSATMRSWEGPPDLPYKKERPMLINEVLIRDQGGFAEFELNTRGKRGTIRRRQLPVPLKHLGAAIEEGLVLHGHPTSKRPGLQTPEVNEE